MYDEYCWQGCLSNGARMMPGAPAPTAPCQGLPSINRGMQGELGGGPGSGTVPILGGGGAKSQDSDPKSQPDPSAATEKLLKFRFYRIKLWNPRCPQGRGRFCWGRSWPGFNPVVLPPPSTPHFFFLFPKPNQMHDRRTLGSLPPSSLAAGSPLNSAFSPPSI